MKTSRFLDEPLRSSQLSRTSAELEAAATRIESILSSEVPYRQAEILRLRMLGYEWSEIGSMFKVLRERAQELHKQAYEQLTETYQ